MNYSTYYQGLSECIKTDPRGSSLTYELSPLKSPDLTLVNGLLVYPVWLFELLHQSGKTSQFTQLILNPSPSASNIPAQITKLISHLQPPPSHFKAFQNALKSNHLSRHLLITPIPKSPKPFFQKPLHLVNGASSAFSALRDHWAASLTPQKIARFQQTHQLSDLYPHTLAILDVHQVMVTGSIFLDPNPDYQKAVYRIQAVFGLSYLFNPDQVVPDIYKVERGRGSIIQKHIVPQNQILQSDIHGNLKLQPLKKPLQNSKLTDADILKCLPAIQSLKQAYMAPHQLVFVKSKQGISFINSSPYYPHPDQKHQGAGPVLKDLTVLSAGVGVSAGLASGPSHVLHSPKDIAKVKPTAIAIIPQAHSLYTPLVSRCAGVIALQGGASSHLSIIAREASLPMVISNQFNPAALRVSILTLDGTTGIIYAGRPRQFLENTSSASVSESSLPTATKRFFELSLQSNITAPLPDDAAGISLNGNSLLKMTQRHAVFSAPPHLKSASLNLSPSHKICLYQFSDPFNLNAQSFSTGDSTNPLISHRGIQAYLQQPQALNTELEWLKKFQTDHALSSLYLITPFTRNPEEFLQFKRLLASTGFHRTPSRLLIASIDTPNLATQIGSLKNIGVDGISLNLNHLLPLSLGYDPYDISFHDSLYQFQPSIATMMQRCLKAAHDEQLFSHVRGFALTKNTQYLDAAVDGGVSAVTMPQSEWGHAATTIHVREERRVLP